MAPHRTLAFLVAATLHAGPLPLQAAEPSVMMGMPVGTTVVVRMREDGLPGFIVDSMTAISATPETGFERRAADVSHAQGATDKTFPIDGGPDGPLPKPTKNVIRFSLKQMEGRPGTLLFIENGYEQGIFFKAEITNDATPLAKGRPTSICPVMASFRSVEHWPYAFRYLKISELAFEDIKPGEPLACR
ncbi:hypothetical protein [Rhizorhabdus dicambivorans]|uniref:Uncharacterized protein n=1 Tax=Rhizorhabdus dicambivorans TaxID=1850238 RepID=A0A2A4FP27_9SPHN|nr:hypothetical protein [Rhizorhabdus dicambivorans]ATE67004.1 hypothetical protein CMV14_23510 [Rhizorhabdus dicambivorans]PCE40515.1 hypothetical protein COO09_20120 [Rhizorhabdus dicambivorans]